MTAKPSPSPKFDAPRGSIAFADCIGCKHLNRKAKTCAAFPDGIPDIVWTGGDTHRTVRPGQEGDTVFEPK